MSNRKKPTGSRAALVADDEQALVLYYIARYCKTADTCGADNITADFPFTRYVFEEGEWDRLWDSLQRSGFLVLVEPGRWRLAKEVTLNEVLSEGATYMRTISTRILRRIPLEAFAHLDAEKKNDPVLGGFASERFLGRAGWWQHISAFSATYDATIEGTSPLSTLAQQLFQEAGLDQADVGHPSVIDQRWRDQGLAFLGAKIPAITPWKSLDAIFYFVNANRFDDDAREQLEADRDKRMLKQPAAVHVLIPLGQPADTAQRLLSARPGFAFLRPDHLRDIAVASKSTEKFREIIKPQIDIRLISPYQLHGPVHGDFFFGRQEEISLVLSHGTTNYAVFGGRRIGKTSLLMRLQRLLAQEDGAQPAYVDCEIIATERDFCHAICSAIQVDPVDSVPAMVSEVKRSGRQQVLLMDEVDSDPSLDPATLDFVLRGLRALANSRQVRLILAGFRCLFALYRNPTTGMHNLADPIRLGGLSMLPAIELATRPMNALGVYYAGGTKMAEKVVALAGRHPNLIQRMCWGLVELLSERKQSTILDDYITEVFEGPAFRKFVDDLFFAGLTRVEQIIVLSCPLRTSFAEHVVFENVRRACPIIPQEEIFAALNDLELAYVFDKEGKSYQYCYEHFPTILQHNHDIDQLLADLARQETEERQGR